MSTGSATTSVGYVQDSPGDEASEVFVVDDTGFVKKGVRPAGVARQYTGTTGKVDNGNSSNDPTTTPTRSGRKDLHPQVLTIAPDVPRSMAGA
jgi:hypothetical protein